MKTFLTSLAVLFFLNLSSFAESTIWSKSYSDGEDEKGMAVRTDPSGNIYVSGTGNDGNSIFPFMLKYNPSGSLLNRHEGHFSMGNDGDHILIDGVMSTYCLSPSYPRFKIARYGADLLNRWVVTGPSRANSYFSAEGIYERNGGGIFVYGAAVDSVLNRK